jgi:hypothetical protein
MPFDMREGIAQSSILLRRLASKDDKKDAKMFLVAPNLLHSTWLRQDTNATI